MAGGKTITFSGLGQAGNLLDPHNWKHNVVPGVNDTAVITMNIGAPMTGVFSVNNMMLLGSETITFGGTLNTAGIGACKGLMVCDGATAIFAPGAVLNDGNVMIVGNEAAGTVLVTGAGATHGVINTGHANIGKHAAGTGVVTIDNGIWKDAGNAVIGDAGSGTLNVIDNGLVTVSGHLVMGRDTGASGKMTIASGGSVSVTGGVHLLGGATHGTAMVSVGAGSSLTAGDSLTIGTGDTLTLTGGAVTAGVTKGCIDVHAGAVISGFGTVALKDGMAIDDDGLISATGGTLKLDANIHGTGAIEIGANSEAMLTGAKLGLSRISFMGAAGTLSLAHGAAVSATISGFAVGDIIEMAGVDAVSFNPANNVLTLSDHGIQVDRLHLAGSFAGDTFAVHQSAIGAMISLQHP